jgi:DNA adenine methylase
VGKAFRITEEVWKQVMDLKTSLGFKNVDQVIQFLLDNYYNSIFTEDKKGRKLIHYPGGDYYIKDHILDLLYKSNCITLVEVFGGSGEVISNADRNVFKVLIYNDIDEEITNFFKVLKEKPIELQHYLFLMPVSRKLKDLLFKTEPKELNDVEKAARFFYLTELNFSGVYDGGFRVVKGYSLAKGFTVKIQDILFYAKKWRDIVIENYDFRDIIRRYDTDKTVFYCDPPYLSTKKVRKYYKYKFVENDMKDLLNILSKIKGKFVLKLGDDQMKFDFVKEFAEKYNKKVIEHPFYINKVVEGKRSKQKTFLIYNF